MRRLLSYIFIAFLLLVSAPAYANTCTWVSTSTKNWSDTTAWTLCGGVAPTAADDVVVAGTGTLTVDGTSGSPSVGRSLDFTGFTGTFTMGASAQLNLGTSTSGKLLFVSGMTYTPNAAAVIKFVSTTTGNNITSAGKSLPVLTFDGVGGAWQFQDNTDFQAGILLTLTNGSLDLNGKTYGATNAAKFSSNNSNTRTLTMGASTFNLPVAGTTNWDIGTSTGMTLSAASSTIVWPIAGGTGTFAGGGLTYGTFTSSALTSGTLTITGANTFGTLTLSNGANTAGAYIFGADQTVTGTLTGNGNSTLNRLFYRSDVKGTARTLSAGTFTFTNIDLQDITKAGAGSGNISAITGGSGDCGNNTGWTFTTPATQYWVPSGGTSTGNTNVITRWANASAGTAGTGRIPLCQDTARFDGSSIDAGARTVTQGLLRWPAADFTGATNTPAWAKGSAYSFFGAQTFISAMTETNNSIRTYEGRGTANLTTGGLSLTGGLTVDSAGGTLNLADNSAWSAGLVVTSGTLTNTGTTTQSFTTAAFNGGTATLYQPTFTTVTAGAGTVTIGAGGGTMSTFTKNSTGTCNINGTTTASGTITLSSTGIWNINANFTGSSTMTQTGATVNIACGKTLAYNNGSFVGPACASGGVVINPGMYGGFN